MSERQKRNVIIISLCGVLLLMTIGYAAFNTLLNINGTASITSNWDIKITDIKQNTKEGDASSVEEFPKYEDLEATFNVNLVSPGDYITYDVTIENKGTIDAELNKIILPQLNNEAVLITTTGLTAGDELLADHSATLTVKIEYNPEVTKQPENKTASFEMKLDYVQKNKAEAPSQTVIDMKGIEVPIVTTGDGVGEDGLYNDPVEPGRYVYKGASPNNYITFNGELWRIIAIETDGTIKIMRNSALPEKKVFDPAETRTTGYCSQGQAPTKGCGVWAKSSIYSNCSGRYTGPVSTDSEIKTYLNETYYKSIATNKDAIQEHNFYYGSVTFENTNLSAQVTDEKKASASSNKGLIQLSDYLKSNTNMEICGTFKLIRTNTTTCKSSSWMIRTYSYWTLTPSSDLIDRIVWIAQNFGFIEHPSAMAESSVIPTIYLKSDVQLSGTGTEGAPYTIENY